MKVKKMRDFLNDLPNEYDDIEILISRPEDLCNFRFYSIMNALVMTNATDGNNEPTVIIIEDD